MAMTLPQQTGYWARWEQRSFGWKAAVEFLHPFGRDYPDAFARLGPLFEALRALPGVEVPPVEWLHATWLHLGFLRAEDIMWSHVETYYVSAAPRLRRLETRPVRLGGIALTDDGRVTLGVEDAGLFRDARKQAAIGAMKAREALRDDPAMTPEGDTFAATIDLAYLDGNAIPPDQWGNPWNYRQPGQHRADSFDLWSNGPDGREGGGDDIANWTE